MHICAYVFRNIYAYIFLYIYVYIRYMYVTAINDKEAMILKENKGG